MSGSDNSLIEELDVEKISVEEVRLIELLNSFGLSESIIESFLVNGYTTETLKIIQRKEIEELIPPPSLAERTKFIHHLDAWRVAQGLPKVAELSTESVSSAIQSTSSGSTTKSSGKNLITRDSCTAAFLLNNSSKGQSIIENYKKVQFLSRSDKKSITHIVIDEFKNRFSKLTSLELMEKAKELKHIFPGEPQETWYQPTFVTDSSGRRKRINKQAKGRLYDRNVNYKEVDHHISQQVIGTSEPSTEKDSDASSTNVELPVRDSFESFIPTFRVLATGTVAHRILGGNKRGRTHRALLNPHLHSFGHCSPGRVTGVFKPMLHIRNHRGYQLVQIDFAQKFSGKDDVLFERWIGFSKVVEQILQLEVADVNGRALLACLDAGEVTEDARNYVIVALLAHILPRAHIKCPGKKRWKPSNSEAQEGVVLHVQQLSDLESTLARLFKGFRDRGISSAPFIVIHGEDWKNPTSFTVWNNVVSYKLPSFLKALDICIKIYKTYSIDYPPQSAIIWKLLPTYLFEIDESEQNPTVESLCSTIRQKLSSE
ncbi:uncharacterized protein LOC134206906 [Armigeres subalbatus]|uniref:uncharacterized protein LOC134206906 n=1 Tax=Armigeres subalbatus TaxID=124917 RepID=UPI002ECFEC03